MSLILAKNSRLAEHNKLPSDPNLLKNHKTLLKWAILVFLSLVWGSSYILMKRGLRTFSYDQMAALRLVWAGLILVPLFVRALRKIQKKDYPTLLIVGIFGNGLPAFLFAMAQVVVPSSLSGMLNSLTPLFSVLIGLIAFRMKTTWQQIAGILIGVGGTALLLQSGTETNIDPQLIPYCLLVVAGTLCYGISVNFIRFKLATMPSADITSVAFGFLLVPAIVIAAVTWTQGNDPTTSPTFAADLAYVALLGILGTGLAVLIFNYLLKISSLLFATSVTYIMPIIAILWGIMDNESFGLLDGMGILVILFGVFLINRFKPEGRT